MYGWIWRKLPFGLAGRITGSLVLIGLMSALLWFVVFPWAEPWLPFDDVQVGDPNSTSEPGNPDDFNVPDPNATYGDEHDNPYDTGEGTPSPRPTRR